jgi:NAD(P)-dependent dehydrogenase (short-subunit alcohol dehydrogenase family)
MENIFSLSGKKILVTGASSGIGRAVAVQCSKMDAQVIVSGRNIQRLNETLSQMDGGNHLIAAGDITRKNDICKIVSELPSLDGIVHCAGIGHRKVCKQLEEVDIDNVMNINFKAPVMLQTEIHKSKKLSKGASVVFIASIAAESPSYGNAIYSASKGALISYANCLGLELAQRQIRVNVISPAMVWTDLILNDSVTKEQLQEDEKKYPLKRYGQPQDVANLAVYLLSDAASWMTISNVKITGGGN